MEPALYQLVTYSSAGDPGFTDGPNVAGDAVGPTSIVDGNWHMMAGVYTGPATFNGFDFAANSLLYVDGLFVASNGVSPVAGSAYDLWIGAAPDYGIATVPPFSGNICHVAVIPQALSAAQIEQLYGAGEPPTVSLPTVTVDQGGDGSIRPTITGAQPLFYQWYYLNGSGNAVLILAATNVTLDLTDIQGVSDIATNLGTAGANSAGTYHGNQATMRGQPGVLPNDAAAHFDGSTQNVLVPTLSTAASIAPPFTVEAWVKPDEVISSGTFCPIGSIYRSSGADGWIIYESGLNWNLRLGDAAGYEINITDSDTVLTNTWYHLMATYDGTNANFYVNGALAGTGASTAYTPNTTVPMGLGSRGDNAFYFAGTVDEAAVYPSVLPTNAAAAHYAAVSTNAAGYAAQILASHPLGYWRLDEPIPQEYFIVVSNAYGVTTSSYVTLNILAGPPVIVADVSPLLVEAPVGQPVTFSVTASGTEPFYYQWLSGGSAVAGATNSSYTFTALADSNTYSVGISNSVGSTNSSTAVVLGLTAPPLVTFNDNGLNWTLNKGPGAANPPTISGNVLTITDGAGYEAESAFFDGAVYIGGGFFASYTYTETVVSGGAAEGGTFCIQNSPAGAAAVGNQ